MAQSEGRHDWYIRVVQCILKLEFTLHKNAGNNKYIHIDIYIFLTLKSNSVCTALHLFLKIDKLVGQNGEKNDKCKGANLWLCI